MAVIQTNFAQLAEHDEQLLRLGLLGERYFPEDPNTSLLKLRQLTELLAQHVATNVGAYVSAEEAQYELIRRLQDQGILPREIVQLFGEVRRAGNARAAASPRRGKPRSSCSIAKTSRTRYRDEEESHRQQK